MRTLGTANNAIMSTQKNGTSSNPLGFNNSRAVLVYDLSIEDVAERKTRAEKFDSVQDCAEHFKTSRHNIMRAIGERWNNKRTGKTYAIRDCGTTPGTPGYGLLSAKATAALSKANSDCAPGFIPGLKPLKRK